MYLFTLYRANWAISLQYNRRNGRSSSGLIFRQLGTNSTKFCTSWNLINLFNGSGSGLSNVSGYSREKAPYSHMRHFFADVILWYYTFLIATGIERHWPPGDIRRLVGVAFDKLLFYLGQQKSQTKCLAFVTATGIEPISRV